MMLLEHDAKTLLRSFGVNVSRGHLLKDADTQKPEFQLPWILKAQVPVGGRGKAGGISKIEAEEELAKEVKRLLGMDIKGHTVKSVRVEELCQGKECYVSLMVDAAINKVITLISLQGGVEVESNIGKGQVYRIESKLEKKQVLEDLKAMFADKSDYYLQTIKDVAITLCEAFFTLELLLVEINPLFIQENGEWVAADAKVVVDDNSISRHTEIVNILKANPTSYQSAVRKLDTEFDFLMLDKEYGNVGLLTTGAGLSMQLLDELTAAGCSPINFCDIRTGQFRGSPDRMIQALDWIIEAPNLKVIFINFFAGITDLNDLAPLILHAVTPIIDMKIPIVMRLIGNGLEGAQTILKNHPGLIFEVDLDVAVQRVQNIVN